MNEQKFSTGIVFDIHNGSYTKAEVVKACGGAAAEVPSSKYQRAFAFKDADNREVLFLDLAHDKWKNSISTENGKRVFYTKFADDTDRLNFLRALRGEADSCPLKLIFAQNINGDKNFRFLGVFSCDKVASGEKDGWYNVCIDDIAAAAPIVACKLGRNVAKFNVTF